MEDSLRVGLAEVSECGGWLYERIGWELSMIGAGGVQLFCKIS